MTECLHKKPNIAEISPHLICALCGGYLIDATTIVECLHSFCKTCIVRYLESSKYCPICEVLVHKTRPLQNIKLDHTLQDIVYKLVPGLFQNEMRRRREFYKDSPTIRSEKARQEQQRERYIFSAEEQFSVALEFCPQGRVRRTSGRTSRKKDNNTARERRYLLCPAGTTIAMLRKFIQLKFALGPDMQVDLVHAGGTLRDHYSLMDVAYIYSWKREGVLELYYTVYKLPPPPMNTTLTEIKDEKHVHYSTDDKLLKPDDNRPSSLFSKASLLGNHAMNRNLHHDLSPLELIATVANDISCLQEGRGLKRKPEVAQLYENDEDASSTETQIKRTVERAIDLCSSNNSKSLKDKKTIVDASASVLPNDPQNRKSSLLKVPGNINEKSSTNEAHNMSKSLPQFKDNKSNSMSATSGKSGLSVQLCDKPIKMDTASQCEHKAKKLKTDLHSKTENIKKSENLTLCSKNSSKPIEPPQNRLKPGESGKNSAKHNTICKPEKIPENDSSKNVLNGSKNKDDTSKLAIKSERAITSKGISKTAADKQLPALPNKTYSGRKSEKQQTGLPSNAIGNRASSSPARTHPSSTAAVSSPARTHPSSTAAVSSPARTHPSSTAAVSSPARTHPSSTAAVSKRQSVAPNHPDPKPSSSKTHVPNQQDKASCNIDQKPNPTETLASNKIDEASRDSDSKPVQKKVGGLRPLFKKSSNAASPMKADKAVAEGKASPQKSSASGNIFELTGNASKLALPVAKNGDTCHTRPESVGDVGDGMKENNNKTDDKGVVDKEETCPVSEKISHPHDKVNEATTKAAPQINGHSTIKDIGSKHHTTAQPTSK